MDDQIQKLLQGAVKAVKAGKPDLARKAFLQVIKLDKANIGAWLGLASVASDKKEQLRALKQALTLDPQNARARRAIEALGIDPDRLLERDAPAPPSDDLPTEQPTETDTHPFRPQALTPSAPPDEPPLPDYLRDMDLPEVDTPEDVDFLADITKPAEVDLSPVGDTPSQDETFETQDETLETQDETLETQDETLETHDETFETHDETFDIADEAPPTLSLEPVDVEALFASLNVNRPGTEGVPVPDGQSLKQAGERADAQMQAYLRDLYDTGDFKWVRKKRGRAGERELTILRAQVGLVVGVIVLGIGALLSNFLVQQAEQMRLAQAPTWTVSPTPTLTPTQTPGITPTPSLTPALSPTPSPTIDPSVTPGSVFVTPQATALYIPVGVAREADVERAASLINAGDFDEALNLLERARTGTAATGNFLPYYYLSIWHLERGDPVSARNIIETGEREWRERSPNVFYDPLVDAAYARVIGAEIRRLQADGATNLDERLQAMEERAQRAIDADGRFTEAYLLLAERFLLAGDGDEALRVLTQAKNNRSADNAFTDTRIRLAMAQLYAQLGEDDLALQEASELLFIDPYNEDALHLQTTIALSRGEAGLAVVFAEQYLARYPDSPRAFYQRGQAWAMEGKFDLALSQYDQALASDAPDDLQTAILRDRADIYSTLRQYDNAIEDLTEALRLLPDDLSLRVLRMRVAYEAGRYRIARDDVEFLTSAEVSGIIGAGELLLLRARIAISEADPTDTDTYEDAIALLNEAVNVRGIPSALRPVASDYLARAHYALGNWDEARSAIEAALSGGGTGSRYYLRGRILEAIGRENDQRTLLQQALRDYEYVLGWTAVYDYPFREELRLAHERLSQQLSAPEPEDS